jgi:tetratricopeptide (TPR) repeat protein
MRRMWMNFRRATAGLLGLVVTLTLAACGGAGNGPDQITPQGWDEEDLPQWVRDLPEGTEPRDDDDTQEATLYLLQAQGRQGDQARDFYQRALTAAERAIERDPENPQGYLLAGEAKLGLGNLNEAADLLDRAEEIYPRYILETEVIREQSWIEHYNAGADALQAEDHDEAVVHFEMAHRIYQGRPDAMLQLARLYTERDRVAEAIDIYGTAIELIESPRAEDLDEELVPVWAEGLVIARFNKAQLLFQQERYLEAAEMYEAVLAEDPDDLMALSNVAISYAAAGESERAMAVYDELLGRPDLDARDYFLIGIGLYQVDEFSQAARAFGMALETVPGHRDAHFNRVQSLFLAEEWEALVAAGEALLEVDTHNRAAHQFLAQGLVRMGQEHEAVAIMEQSEDLPFEVSDLQSQRTPQGVAVMGQVVNRSMAAGTTVRFRVFIYSVSGEEVGRTEATVTLGEVEEPVMLQAEFRTNADVLGFRYEVIG